MPRVHNDRSSVRHLWSSRARADACTFLSWIVEIKWGPFFDITLVPYETGSKPLAAYLTCHRCSQPVGPY